ncbi:MAG: hypothetical protein U0528_19950 [Anaerolineae bacterium]
MTDQPIPDVDHNAVSMEDFIFGTLSTDELRLQQIVETRRGLAHERRNQPRDPLPGTPVQIEVTAGPEIAAAEVQVQYSINDGEAESIQLSKGTPIWDTLLWSYLDTFSGELPAQADGSTVRYRITANTLSGATVSTPDTYSYNVDKHRVPVWVSDAAIYRIFMDRFADSEAKQLADHDNLGDLFGGKINGCAADWITSANSASTRCGCRRLS